MKINKAWHLKHIMPKNASLEQRAKWHLAHQKNCSCRLFPEKLAKKLKEAGINI